MEGVDIMNSADTEHGFESELVELDEVPFTRLRGLRSEMLRESMLGVVERARRVQARYRSSGQPAGERVD